MTTSGTPSIIPPDSAESLTPATVSNEVLKIEAERAALGSEPIGSESPEEGTAEAAKRERAGKRAKSEPETLAQVLEYAYGRKGQPLTLKPKVEKQVAHNPQLNDLELSHMLQLARSDKLLVVPRQILLLSQDVRAFPSLRVALTSFVSNVMLSHPVFSDTGVQRAIRNLPEGLQPADALARVANFEPSSNTEIALMKGSDLRDLRCNAVNLFIAWLAVNRSLSSEELSTLLFQVIWQPAAKDLADDNLRLRALTDITQTAGVGLACHRFRQQAIEVRAQQDQTQREATNLRDRLATAEAQLSETSEQLAAVQVELEALQESSSAEIGELHHQHAVDRTHLQHKLEQLRGRLVKRLTDSIEMLDVGLSALCKDTPRVQVMTERAEHVIDALRAEVQELRGE